MADGMARLALTGSTLPVGRMPAPVMVPVTALSSLGSVTNLHRDAQAPVTNDHHRTMEKMRKHWLL